MLGHVVQLAERFCDFVTDGCFDFILLPDVEFAFDAFTVCIFGAVEGPRFVGQVMQNVVQRFAGDGFVKRVPRELKHIDVADSQQRVVVKHFLEVRNQPAFIDAIASKTATEVIVDSSPSHFLQVQADHRLQCFFGRALQRGPASN